MQYFVTRDREDPCGEGNSGEAAREIRNAVICKIWARRRIDSAAGGRERPEGRQGSSFLNRVSTGGVTGEVCRGDGGGKNPKIRNEWGAIVAQKISKVW